MAITIMVQPVDYVGEIGNPFAFDVYAAGTDGETISAYLLQYRTIGTTTWLNGFVTTRSWHAAITAERVSREYRWRVTGSQGTVVYSSTCRILTSSDVLTVVLQTNNSENNKVDKSITDVITLTGHLRAECSLMDPVIRVDAQIYAIADVNYATIAQFGRSYFVSPPVSVRDGLVELSMHVDVLTSFKAQIRANQGIVRRAENDVWNLYLNDGSLVAYQDPYILTEPFPAGFTGHGFILAVAGA